MAIWEMTSLLIAPKKVFRSIYYHVRLLLKWNRAMQRLTMSRNVCFVHHKTKLPLIHGRNQKHMASTRSLLHLPALFLHAHHWHSMGYRIHQLCGSYHSPHTHLHFRTLPLDILARGHGGILPGRETVGARDRRIARTAATAGAFHERRGRRVSGVRVLL